MRRRWQKRWPRKSGVWCLESGALSLPPSSDSRLQTPDFLKKLLIRFDSHFIDAVVFRMAAVSGDARVSQLMSIQQLVQPLPQFGILDRTKFVALAPAPSVSFPTCHPFGQSLADI